MINQWGTSGTGAKFQKPADATAAEFGLLIIGANTISTGTIGCTQSCGDSLFFCALLPIPASVNCGRATAPGAGCPPGCALEGPILGPTCKPVTPQICYQAISWTLTLTSVELYSANPVPTYDYPADYAIHGMLTANLAGGNTLINSAAIGGTAPAVLSLTF
ncbi:MAG: hypothetical protein ABJA82_16230 [Myxococcales bacterium]